MHKRWVVVLWLAVAAGGCVRQAADAAGEETTGVGGVDEGMSSSEGGVMTVTGAADSSTGPAAVCGDGACGEGEDAEGCYADCGACGNGEKEGLEACDNGENADEVYTAEQPGEGACAAGCMAVEWCGDGAKNGPEACDEGGVQTAGCEANCAAVKCGDGVWNASAGEACDDGNEADGDGCAGDCSAEERRVFATSAMYEGDMNFAKDNPDGLMGMALADARCQGLAAGAGLTGTYLAWLSDGAVWPGSRFDTGFVGLYRVVSAGYPVIAEGWEDLTDGALMHGIDADETGKLIEDAKNVWTNTTAEGEQASEEHCTGWTVKDNTTTVGLSSATDTTWSDLAAGQLCSVTLRLYCFED